ncbi:MAG: GAF domain-containing protein [bacterium]|nr:GAF domain-containing protein [bacterium]
MNKNISKEESLTRQVGKLKRQLETIYRVNSFLSSITDLNELLILIMTESKKIVNCEASSLMLYDAVSDELYFEVVLGDKSGQVKEVRLQMGQGIAGRVAQDCKVINVKDVSEDSGYDKSVDDRSQFQTKSLLALPLTRGDKLIGVIEVLNKCGGDSFSDEDIKIMEILAEYSAIAIENAQLVQENIKSAKLAAIGQAVAGTAHYIKNILAGIKGGMSLVEMGLKGKNWELLDKSWPICKRSNMKINKLVNDMLTYSKDREPIKEHLEVSDIIGDVCDIVNEKAKQKQVFIKKEHQHDQLLINVEQSAIGDAILNLVSNSIDAIDKKEGTIHLKTKKDTLFDKDMVVITITDNGSGIPADVIEKIFDPFFSTKGSKGTGIGLAVTKKVIDEHEGCLEVESVPGEGTTFSIYLPAVDAKGSD